MVLKLSDSWGASAMPNSTPPSSSLLSEIEKEETDPNDAMLPNSIFLGFPHPKSDVYTPNFGDEVTKTLSLIILIISTTFAQDASASLNGCSWNSMISLPIAVAATRIPFSPSSSLFLAAVMRNKTQFPKYVLGNFRWPLQSTGKWK
ncbi:hypothetical protein GQ457_16G011190 [Hibiscus cannabinus]